MSIIWRLTLTLYLRHVPFLGKSLEWGRCTAQKQNRRPGDQDGGAIPARGGRAAGLLVGSDDDDAEARRGHRAGLAGHGSAEALTLQHGGQSSRTGLGVAGLDMFSGTNSIAASRVVVAEHDRHILDVAAA